MHPEALFYIFGQGVYAYGICVAVGVIACFAFLMFTMKVKKFNELSSDAVILIGILGTGLGFLSGMLFQAIYGLIDTGKFEFGGMTFIGGLIGGVIVFLGVWNLYMFVIRPRTKIKWLNGEMNATLTDALPFIPIGIVIAHAFGRLGCFFGGCCYGKAAEWGLPCAAYSSRNVIPTQLFEMAFLFVLAAVMAFLYFKYRFNYNFSVYLIAYGIWRFGIEYLRDDYRGEFIGNVTPSQFWSILMVILGIGYIFAQYYLFSKMMKHPENSVPEAAEVTETAGESAPNADAAQIVDESAQPTDDKKDAE